MQIDINVKTYSTKQRILAFFMAFMIFTMTCPELFEGLGVGLIVHAEEPSGNIHYTNTDNTSLYKDAMNTNRTGGSAPSTTPHTGSTFTYTGKYNNNNKTTVFDYVSDYELAGTYNICLQNESGYVDAYKNLNKAISVSNITAGTSDVITIRFKKFSETAGYLNGVGDVCIYFYGGTKFDSGWHDSENHVMNYQADTDSYVFYLDCSTWNDTDSIMHMIIRWTDFGYSWSDSSHLHQTQDIENVNFKKSKGGKIYTFTYDGMEDLKGKITWYSDDGDCIYSTPLYFGDFWRDNSAGGYHGYNKADYNNFWWQANMGMKTRNGATDTSSPDHFNQRGHAVVQELVYGKLSGSTLNAANATGDILDKSGVSEANNAVSGNALPLFSTAWINDANHTERQNLIKYYDTDIVDDKDYNITFPFYETYSALNQNTDTVKVDVTDSNSATNNEVARYYQFDSKEANLRFNIDPDNNHAGYFSESTGIDNSDIYFGSSIDSDRGNVGFFPFNSSNWYNSNNSRENNHNLGFGTKMSMDFQLENDGCVSAVKLNNSTGKLESLDTATRIHTIFEFTGDDDLWVFIDGNLVLDMGGPHYAAHGIIDFAGMSATVSQALKFGTNSSGTETTAYDALDAQITDNKALSGSAFINQLAGDNQMVSGSPVYDTSVTHTMTIFYMERGMLDSNLLIRYNYSPISNTSRMKIAEVTKFNSVNPGLKTATQMAAEGDVFKYTVTNTIPTGVTIVNPLDSGAKYPITTEYTRTAEGNSSWTTKLTPNGTGTSAEKKFVPGNVNVETYVKDTAYWWVDDFSNTDYMVGKTTNSSGTNPGGDLWLMYGTNDSVYDSSNTGKESSAEFEKQFSPDSTMKVVQGANIYRLPRSGNTATLFDNSGNIQATEDNNRAVSDYYTTQYRLVDRNGNTLFNVDSDTYSATGTNAQNSSFTFANDSSVSSHLAVMLTEYVENTVNTGTLIVKKVVSGQSAPADSTEYTFNLQLKNVFGVANNDVDNYSSIAVTKTAADSSTSFVTLGADGTFKLKKGEKISISGVPVGTRYIVTETGTNNATVTGEVKPDDAEKTIAAKNGEYTVTVTNTFPDFQEISVEKTNSNGTKKLSGAELELWYKETVTPPTYSFNEEPIAPFKKNGMKIDTTVGIPGLAESNNTTYTYTETTTYNNPAVPDAQDKDWILPRSDSDYIYFRDYNSADATGGGYIGDKDKTSFGSSNKVAWRQTFFAAKSEGTHHQVQEIGFSNQSEWIAAQFTKNGGKDMVQYAVWERFVDNYNGTNTVVWKIQPPDGYTEVRFCLYDGDNCIRTTERFNYELGKIYHKTNWGTYYSDANGGSYWDVPVTAESNNGYWAPTTNDSNDQDKRMTGTITGTNGSFTYTGQMTQPKKYEPTDQKIIFHCNSAKVWHNIHIQFFTDENGTNSVNGQPFPGYMMEPYAYAGSDYRMDDGYLTYELTIPKDAVSFQINNGVSSGDYAFKTVVKKLYTATDKGAGSKNYGNYFCLGNYETNDSNTNTDNPKNDNLYTLTDWTDINDTQTATYPTVDVDSDYDYIYFEKPTTGWNGHVYAYFYGGGNLRADNWQRACYSAWPGVAAAGTEYTEYPLSGTPTPHYSTTYTYSATTGNAYTATGSADVSNPDTTLTLNGKMIYKFRIPKGDRTNYSKVIFNDGLSSQSGGNETGVIAYKPGYLYNKDGQETKHYENGPTVSYTAETGADSATEYIYIKMDSTTASTWDDPHITFYDSNGTQILQGGCGYVMDYAGTYSNNTYFKVPIPNDAKKFSVNNGIGTSATGLYDIERLTQTSGAPKATAESGDKFVYTLSGSALTRDGYSKTMTQSATTTTTVQSEDTTGYGGVRKTGGTDDVLALRDKAVWNAPINGITVRFYNASGAVIGSGSYNMMVTNADGDGYKWYTKKIPTNAAAFDVTYIKNSTTNVTPKYPIYPATTADDNGNVTTTGDMYYETVGTNTLSVYNAVPSTTEADDETYAKRGDYLYLIYASEQDPVPKVTFKAGNDAVIKSNVTAKYLNEKDGKHWYKVSIPEGAASFEVEGVSGTGNIYELKKTISRYEQNYTIGDMQYEITDGSLECKYPIFTKDTDYELTVSDGKTISSRDGAAVVDASAVSQYANADTAPLPTTNSTLNSGVVVHNTTSDTIPYTWTEGSEDNNIYFDNSQTNWSSVRAYFYTDSNHHYSTWDGSPSMTQIGTSNIYKIEVPLANYNNVVFYNGSNDTQKTPDISLLSDNYGRGKKITAIVTTVDSSRTYLYWVPDTAHNNNQFCWFYSSDSDSSYIGVNYTNSRLATENVNGNQLPRIDWNTGQQYNGINVRGVVIPSNASYVQFGCSNDNNAIYTTGRMAISNIPAGEGLYVTNVNNLSDGWGHAIYSYFDLSEVTNGGVDDGSTTITCTVSEYSGSSTSTTYTTAYQPEDRYGLVDKTGNTDTNNFITINTQLSDPYIIFYTSTDGSGSSMADGQESGGSGTTTGIKLAALDTDSNTSNTSYKIRLPKYAKSFKIKNGATGTASAAQALEGSVKVTSASDGTYNTSGNYTISNFRHAGTTFNVSADSPPVISITSLRSGYTVTKQPNMTDPLNPKTDADYVFFTDVNNTIGGSGTNKTVYAYFYGDVDGEYKAWPGIAAVAPNVNTTADTSYTDNNNQTVYAFRIPKDLDGKYKYVIFNNGTTDTHKATEAKQFTGGKNYVLNTTTSTYQYGSFVESSNVYPVTEAAKATANTTTVYSTAGTSNYIYIINNGTQNIDNNTVQSGRYELDEMHVVFYDANKSVIGNAAPGYKPDKISGTNVYKIQVPSNAQYFQINNGANKWTSSGTDDNENYRQSEIKVINANGLYKFVDSDYLGSIGKGNTAENYIEGSNVPTSAANRYRPNYLLGLTNVIKTDDNKPVSETIDIHLATVVTGTDGKIDHIKWLKDSTTSIDHEYLANENADGKVVKVKKQGDYYWKETIAPSGYQVNPDQIPVSNGTATVTDPENPKGSLTLSKNLRKPSDTAHTTTSTDTFTFTVVLTAPVGTNWASFVTTPTFSSTETGATHVSTTDDGLTRTIEVNLPADNTSVVIDNIPSGTAYYVTETSPSGYSSTPVSISETMYKTVNNVTSQQTASVNSIEGTIPDYTTAQSTNNNVSYAVTNQRKVGSLTLGKTVSGTEDALSHAGVNQNGEHTSFTFKVTLTAPTGIHLKDYISWTALSNLGASEVKVGSNSVTDQDQYNSASGKIEFKLSVKAGDGTKTINNLPYGTTYTVEEVDPTNTHQPTKPNVTWSKSGEIESTVPEANRTINSAHPAPSVTINNEYSYQETPGSLTISKTVSGQLPNGMENAYFKFTVTLGESSGNLGSTARDANSTNTITAPTTLTAGTSFAVYLKHGESITFKNIPSGTAYSVAEDTNHYYTDTNSDHAIGNGEEHSHPANTRISVTNGSSPGTISQGTSATVAVTNTYPEVGKLNLKKEMVSGSEETSNFTSFPYTVTLTTDNDTGVDLTKYLSSDYITSTLGGTFTQTNNANNYGIHKIEFVVNVTSATDGNKLIENIPYGTAYTVTEQNQDGWIQIGEAYGRADKKIGDEDTNKKNTYTATNAKIGSLTLKKEIATGTTGQNNTLFEYKVQLTAPSSMKFTKEGTGTETKLYIESTTNGKKQEIEIDPQTIAIGVTPTNEKFSGEITITNNTIAAFKLHLSREKQRAIKNIPYGVTYTVEEVLTTDQTNAGWKQVGEPTYTDSTEKKIGNSTEDVVTIKNGLVGSIKLKKTVNGNTAIAPDTFEFEVTLTPPTDMSLAYFANHYLNVTVADNASNADLKTAVDNVTDLSLDDNDAPNAFKKTVTVNKNGTPVKIEGLPYGTKYTVTEKTALSTNATKQGEVTTEQTINSSRAAVTITNTYPGTLTLKKQLSEYTPFNVTNDKTFTFNVTLQNGSTNFNVKVDGVDTEITGGTKTFNVDVSVNHQVVIENIPIGTTYTVTEAASEPEPSSKSGEVTTETALTGNEPIKTVTITNTYTEVPKTITLFKQDAESHAGIPGAQFYLVKLKSDLDITSETVQNDFKTGTIANDTNDNNTLKLKVGDTFKDYFTVVAGVFETQTAPDNDHPNNECGTIKLTEGNAISPVILVGSISFVVGDRYFFFETDAATVTDGTNTISYKKDNTLTPAKVISINNAQNEYSVIYDNERIVPSEDVDVHKVDESKNDLENAKIDLWYKNVEIPSVYEPNSLLIPPLMKIITTVTGDLTPPEAEKPSTLPTPSTYTYQYTPEEVPVVENKDWILPRSDNDYIYFRDYNTGNTYSGDTGAFRSDDDNTRWINTWFDKNQYGQNDELIYDTSLWIKAKFTAQGKPELNYSVWERFVDKYTVNGHTYDTVVWKIQPPDGYTNVEFILCRGDNHLRNTQSFKYVLGNIYTKTNEGIYDGGQYGYPVKGEHWSTNWNGTGNSVADKRMSYSTFYNSNGTAIANAGVNNSNYVYSGANNTTSSQQAPKQTERYAPTEQKIVFHCNSKVVWHNIHIEFFTTDSSKATNSSSYVTDGGTTYYYMGQGAPGYLMEPYAYAGDDYRIYGYLTYELTIPEGATHFRVNNGVTSGAYNFRSQITPFKHIEGRKNYGNYFKIIDADRNVTGSNAITLNEWTNYTSTGDKWTESYSSLDVTSDYDYIYFAAPSGWGTHIYAYFYGGGDLRKHNSLRACYSVWPGVAPVGTEYTANSTDYHSDTYHYTYSGDLYTGNSDSLENAPDSNFKFTKNGTEYTVYKFRVPKGDRKNYKKVIFNNGLSTLGSPLYETKVIPDTLSNTTYQAGCIYMADGTCIRHYDQNSTSDFTKRGTGDDYIYIKTREDTWDDMHIVFYDNSGRQILQSGTGYVMEYSGKNGSNSYYRMAIPTNAAKFSLNNGRDKSGSYNHNTAQYDILRLDPVGNDTSTDYTKDRIVYSLSGNTLTLTAPTFVEHERPGTSAPVSGQDARIDYTVRGAGSRTDTLYIRDTANWNIEIADGTIRFYDANGSLIRGNGTKGKGTYTLIKSVKETTLPTGVTGDLRPWYSINIPEGAETFTVSYHDQSSTSTSKPLITTSAYDIYPFGTDSEINHTTTGNMYYQTEAGGKQLSLLTGTYSSTAEKTYSYTARSNTNVNPDYLYLVCSDKSKWSDMKVTFKDASGAVISGAENVAPEYLDKITYEPIAPVDGVSSADENAVGDWFRVPIPTDAASFTVTDTDTTDSTTRTSSGVIYQLKDSISRYEKDYTLGGMEYRLPDSGTNSTLLYPIFTEYKATEADAYESKQADASKVSTYANAAAATLPTSSATAPTDTPVLYETTTGTVTYEWGEDSSYIYFVNNSNTEWTDICVCFFDGNTNAFDGIWPGTSMTSIGENIYRANVPTNIETKTNPYVIFNNNNGKETVRVSLNTSNNFGRGYIFTPTGYAGNYVYYDRENWPGNVRVKYIDSNGGVQNTGDIPYKDGLCSWEIVSGAEQFYFIEWNNGNDYHEYGPVAITSNSAGKVYRKNGNGLTEVTNHSYTLTGNGKFDGVFAEYGSAGGGTATATYQPEDRYGYINDVTDTADANNFIYISTALSNPTIHFYSGDNGTGTIADANADISLAYTKVNDTGVTAPASPYAIRLPKTARSFILTAGGKSVTQALYDGTYHHAGSTFTVADNGATLNVTDVTRRTGYTDGRTTLEDPLNPRSDADFVFFTDTDGTFANSNKVYAYFYGNVDGEYAAWPGNVADKTSAEPTTYTDNNGNTVYMFRVPQGSSGKYSYVIFNDGVTTNARKITQAVKFTAGKNYVLDTTAANTTKYGTVTTQAYAVNKQDKALSTSAPFSVSNKTIYIVNNGTYNFGKISGEDRHTFDEMHVVFYDMYHHVIGAESGYIPDLLTGVNKDGKQVYRIRTPDNAKYFQITNGVNKGMTDVEGTPTDTHLNERFSVIAEIADNGLYQFVPSASNDADYIEGSNVPTSKEELYTPKYLLKLLNPINEDLPEIKITEVKLATVVTKKVDDNVNNGNIDHIEWLKPMPADPMPNGKEYNPNDSSTYQANTVDTEYLDHTTADIYNSATGTPKISKVKVKKEGTYYWKESAAPSGYKTNTELYYIEYKDGKVYYYDENNDLVEMEDDSVPTIVNEPEDEPEGGYVELTKVAKDATHQVTEQGDQKTVTQIKPGNSLGAGYGFLLYKGDGQLVDGSVINSTTGERAGYIYKKSDGTYYYSSTAQSGTQYNTASDTVLWEGDDHYAEEAKNLKTLMTDKNGKIKVENLPYGDYYFMEVATPDGSLYSENFIHGWLNDSNVDYYSNAPKAGKNNSYYKYYGKVHNRVYFTVGENNTKDNVLQLTCEDEMAPAYLRLYEHIDEWKPDKWGSPTFIFKIKQTHVYSDTDHDPRNAEYTKISDGKEYIVALTVDDGGTMTMDYFSGDDENSVGTKGNHQGINFDKWYVETTAKDGSGNKFLNGGIVSDENYQGANSDNIYSEQHLFGLNSAGMLPLEPGKYTISRVNPSRYEFVTNYSSYATAAIAPWLVADYNDSDEQYVREQSKYREWYHDEDNEINSTDKGSTINNPAEKRDGYMLEYGRETITELELQPYRVATIHYYDRVAYYDKFSQVDTEINSFHQYTNESSVLTPSIKGIRLEFRGKAQINADSNTASIIANSANADVPQNTGNKDGSGQLNAYFINVDGSERAMTADEKAKLTFTPPPSSDDSEDESTDTFKNDFSFNAETHKITISNAKDHANSVYTLNAVYDNKFKTDVDIVIGGVPTSTNP